VVAVKVMLLHARGAERLSGAESLGKWSTERVGGVHRSCQGDPVAGDIYVLWPGDTLP